MSDASTICKVCSLPCDKIGDTNSIGFEKQYCCNDFIKEFGKEIPKCNTCVTTTIARATIPNYDLLEMGFQEIRQEVQELQISNTKHSLITIVEYCPNCGESGLHNTEQRFYDCEACQWVFKIAVMHN